MRLFMSVQSSLSAKVLIPCAFSFVFLASGSKALAENPAQRGRLPDGRAYRIDQSSGLRLSDYVAELEVSNDDLKRQLIALEDELNERREQIQQYEKQTGVKLTPKIKESTLVDKSSSLPPATRAPITCSPNDPPMAALMSKVKELETQLKTQTDQLAMAKEQPRTQASAPVTQVAKCDFNSPQNPYIEQVNTLRKTLAETPGKEALEKAHEAALTSQAQLAQASRGLSEKDAQIAKLQEQLAATKEEVLNAHDALSKSQAKHQEVLQTARREESPVHAVETRARQNTQAHVAEVAPEYPPVADDRAEFQVTLTRIQNLVVQRKNLLDSVKSSGKGISVSIQPLVTKGRISLDDTRMNVQRFQNGQDASGIRNTLSEIEAILNDDIKVLQRLAH